VRRFFQRSRGHGPLANNLEETMKRWKRHPRPGSWTAALLAAAAAVALALCGPPAGSAWATEYIITGGPGAAGGSNGVVGSATGGPGTPDPFQTGTGSGSNQSGQAEVTTSSTHSFGLGSATGPGDALSITGGSGGDGGDAGGAGKGFGGGRGARLTITPWANVPATVKVGGITLAGGAAGAGGDAAGSFTAGDGGSAGYAALDFGTIFGAININVTNDVVLTATNGGPIGATDLVSGNKGGNGGNGGNVTLNAGSLIGGGSFTLTTGNNGLTNTANPVSGGTGTVGIFAAGAAAGEPGQSAIMRLAGPITINAQDGAADVDALGAPNGAAASVGTGGAGEISAYSIVIRSESDSLGNVDFWAVGGAATSVTAGVAGDGLIKAAGGISVTIGENDSTDLPNNPNAKTVTITARGGASEVAGGVGGDGVIDAGNGALDIKSLGRHAAFAVTAQGGYAIADGDVGGNALIRGNGISIASGGSIASASPITVDVRGGAGQGANSDGGNAEVISALADGSAYADLKIASENGSGRPVELNVTGASGNIAGSGGAATVTASDITVSTSTASTGSARLGVLGGDGNGSEGDGGKAVINASGTLHVTALNADAGVSVSGGGGLRAPGDGELHAAGIVIKSDQGADEGTGDGGATVNVQGHQGGNAKVESSGDVLVQVASGGTSASASLIIEGGGNLSIPGRNGGDASLTAAGIAVTGTLASGTSVAVVMVKGGDCQNFDQSGGTVKGGAAVVTASGAIKITGDDAIALFDVIGGNGFDKSDAGSAAVTAAGVTIESGAKDASLSVTAGAAGFDAGSGAAASLTSAGAGGAAANVTVNAKGAGVALLDVMASDNVLTDAAGHDATLRANDLIIRAEKGGPAAVSVAAGGTASSDHSGGDALVDLAGNLMVAGGSDSGAPGVAYLTGAGGAGAGPANNGKSSLEVAGTAFVLGGDAGAAGIGGGARAAFDMATVAERLTVRTGADGAAGKGGDSSFSAADTLRAPSISLERAGGLTALTFDVKDLDLTAGSTEIALSGTKFWDGAELTGARVSGNVNIANGHRLSLFNSGGQIGINHIDARGEEAELYIEDSANAAIGSIDAEGSRFTILVPTEFPDNGALVSVSGLANFDGAEIIVSGDLRRLSEAVDPTIIRAGTLSSDGAAVVADRQAQARGLTRRLTFDFDMVGNAIVATYTGLIAAPELKTLSEGQAAAAAFLNNGSDLVADEGVANAVFAAAEIGPSFFSAVGYGRSRHQTGSHVDVDGLSMLLGGAFGVDVPIGRLTVGAFLELGEGGYDSYNDFAGIGAIEGSGDTRNVGGGLLARLDFAKSEAGWAYAELSGRIGRASSDFRSDYLPASRFDLDSTYYGLHAGLGRVFNLTDRTSLDLYGKWLFTRKEGNSIVIEGDRLSFDDVDSHRLRAGARLSTALTGKVKPFFGAAYERGFDGRAKASVEGLPVDAPELKGGTGIGELGLSVTAAEGLTFDLGLRGYVGARRGVSGTFNLTYNF
jgi:hypothetical protein